MCQSVGAAADMGIVDGARSTAVAVGNTAAVHSCGVVAGSGMAVPHVAFVAKPEIRCQ